MIQAVIFDMDGLLIDSEPLWKEAEIQVLQTVGVPLTWEMTSKTTGLRVDEVVHYWHQKYPWSTPTQAEITKQIEAAGLALIRKKGIPKAGVDKIIALCQKHKFPIAIASSSSLAIIHAVVDKLHIKGNFKVIHSAEFEAYGKPHPAVYISAARKLGVTPQACLAFEDSANGVLSAKAAKMHCIAVPEPELRSNKRFGIADIIVDSLEDVTPEMIQRF